ncbi:MAG: transglycosylase SLT domain-containing protein [Myxococcota bacterium]
MEAQDPEGPQPESEPEAREAAGSEASDADETAEDPENTEEETFDPGPSAIALARALDARLTVWQAGERRVYVRHCRNARVDCRARVVALSRLISESAHRHQVDPFLVAAMALRESGLNPFAEGSVGERGIVQLHPRGVGSRVRFVRSEGYRRRCERRPDACQAEVIEAGASHVASAMERCGSVPEALGAYNTGVCQETGYSRRVLEERENLLRLAKARVSARAAQLVD